MNNGEETPPEKAIRLALEHGMIRERNRILTILIKYKEAGWIDDATAFLLAQDVAVHEDEE